MKTEPKDVDDDDEKPLVSELLVSVVACMNE